MPSTLKAASTVRSPCGTETVMYSPVGESDTLVNSGSLKKVSTGRRSACTRGAVIHSSSANRTRKDIVVFPGDLCGRSGGFRRLHRGDESIEQLAHVVRTGAGLGMALERERRRIGQLDALVRAIEQRSVRDAHVRWQRRLVDGEAVVLARNHH